MIPYFRVLGTVSAEFDGRPVNLRGPRHREVLARLIVARGRMVTIDELVDDLWPDAPPPSAVGTVRTFVAHLRRVLEPDRSPRTPASLLVTVPPGYALRVPSAAIDVGRFETLTREAGEALNEGRFGDAYTLADEALVLWNGPAYAQIQAAPWVTAEKTRLDELRLVALERRAAAAVDSGRHAETVPELEALLDGFPLREELWRLLALGLYRGGRQGDALDAVRRAKTMLGQSLGLDPSRRLRELESDILTQASYLEGPHAAGHGSTTISGGGVPALHDQGSASHPAEPAAGPNTRLVGRDTELARLSAALRGSAATGAPALIVVTGGAGAGKTALTGAVADGARREGWVVARGTCVEFGEAPAAWPWTEALAELTAAGFPPAGTETAALASLVPYEDAPAAGLPTPDAATATVDRFRMHRALAAYLARVSTSEPTLLILDDLHWADEQTLLLLRHLVRYPTRVPLVVVTAYRDTETGPALEAALADLARAEPLRLRLAGLDETAVAELITEHAGMSLNAADISTITRRTGGNPFFVRETARLLATEGLGAALRLVPTGVREVIEHRVAALSKDAFTFLRRASVYGMDIHPDLLGGAGPVLDAIEEARAAGLLADAEPPGLRFAHQLIRDTLYDGLSPIRRSLWHREAAQALERLRPDDVAALATHYGAVGGAIGGADVADRVLRYATAAADLADRRFAPAQAARWRRMALAAHETTGSLPGGAARLELTMDLVRSLAQAGEMAAARRLRHDAVSVAESHGDPVLTARVIVSFNVPTLWPNRDHTSRPEPAFVETVERTLATLPADSDALRCRLLTSLAFELEGTGSERGARAAVEAENLARALGDPMLLALALNSRYQQNGARLGTAAEQRALGAELVVLGEEHCLGDVEVLGHLIQMQGCAAHADWTGADGHADAAAALAERYALRLPQIIVDCYRPMRALVDRRFDDADVHYHRAAAGLASIGIWGLDRRLLMTARFCALDAQGRLADLADLDPAEFTDWDARHGRWARMLALAEAGRTEEAAALLAASDVTRIRPNLLRGFWLTLAARAAVALGAREVARAAYEALLPAAGELAGALSGTVTLGPVDDTLQLVRDFLGESQHACPAA